MSHNYTAHELPQSSDSNQRHDMPRSFPYQEQTGHGYSTYPNVSLPPPPFGQHPENVSHTAAQFLPPPPFGQHPGDPSYSAAQFLPPPPFGHHPGDPSHSSTQFVPRPQWNQRPIPEALLYRQENIQHASPQRGTVSQDWDSSPEADQLWVHRYFTKTGKNPISDDRRKKKSVRPALQICNARDSVNICVEIVHDLKTLEKELKDNINVLNPEEWEEKCLIIASKRAVLTQNLGNLSLPTVTESLHASLAKRRKKREWQKRRRALRKKTKADAAARRRQLHKDMDEWLREMQLAVDKAKADESLKNQADIVLADVTRKQAEARRQLTLLSMLVKLRKLRVQATSSRGERVSAEQVEIFENVVGKLTTFWADQLAGYDVEETGLRLMMEEETQEQKKNVSNHQQAIFNDWQRLLFGRTARGDNPYLIADHDVESFVAIRRDWDKFVTPIAAPMASSIPIGWVLPAKPSSSAWGKLLNTNQTIH